GLHTRRFNYLGIEATGVDVSPAAVAFASGVAAEDPFVRRDVALRFACYDGYALPFADGSFDQIACFDAFHHVPNKAAVFGELARVLADGGRLTYVEPGAHHDASDQARRETRDHGVLEDSVSLDDV